MLSVIIPNWNGARHLPTCLDALREQSYLRMEVIVVDNASADESQELLRTRYPEVRTLVLERNVGLTGAMNRGFQLARGELIASLNNDTQVTPTWANQLVHALQKHPEAGMAASKILLFDRRDVLHSAGDMYSIDGIPVNRGVWQRDEGQFDREEYVWGACGGAALYRREMLEDIGFFDEELFMYCEDVDLNWRAQLAGYRCIFVPQAVVYHKLSATGGGKIASYFTGRNTIWVLAKNYPEALWRRHWRKVVYAQWRIAHEALRAWKGEAARARLLGQLAGLLGLPHWLKKRHAIRRLSRVPVDVIEQQLLTQWLP
ncbi:MAG: glycosyltransferase family 2 protein [Ardenticatenia bacterium]|nr:MAG: glycosyltransferase family 2 protein [Ardenticatenia bacterium]